MNAGHPEEPTPPLSATIYPLPPASFLTEPDPSYLALTDIGRAIPLFHFEAYIFPSAGEQLTFHPENEGTAFLRMAEHNFLVNTKQDFSQLNRLSEPSTQCNCHGWVFAGGRFLVQDAHVPTLLADNGYQLVKDAREGDIAIFLNEARAAHSGFVRQATESGSILLESKWGPFGVFAHTPAAHPFPGECHFYRSSRVGHTLMIAPRERSTQAVGGRQDAGEKSPSVADLEGPWVDPGFESGLVQRCESNWLVPIATLSNEILAMFLRQRVALALTIPEAQKRLSAGLDDGSEAYEGQLATALRAASKLK